MTKEQPNHAALSGGVDGWEKLCACDWSAPPFPHPHPALWCLFCRVSLSHHRQDCVYEFFTMWHSYICISCIQRKTHERVTALWCHHCFWNYVLCNTSKKTQKRTKHKRLRCISLVGILVLLKAFSFERQAKKRKKKLQLVWPSLVFGMTVPSHTMPIYVYTHTRKSTDRPMSRSHNILWEYYGNNPGWRARVDTTQSLTMPAVSKHSLGVASGGTHVHRWAKSRPAVYRVHSHKQVFIFSDHIYKRRHQECTLQA